jgi:hypothetical protein
MARLHAYSRLASLRGVANPSSLAGLADAPRVPTRPSLGAAIYAVEREPKRARMIATINTKNRNLVTKIPPPTASSRSSSMRNQTISLDLQDRLFRYRSMTGSEFADCLELRASFPCWRSRKPGSRCVPKEPERQKRTIHLVNVTRAVWAAIQGDPRFMRRLNGWLTILWIVMIPVSYSVGWLKSVTYVSALSLWALVSGHWSTWQAARVEVSQQEQIQKEEEHPVEERVVETIVEKTDVEKNGT